MLIESFDSYDRLLRRGITFLRSLMALAQQYNLSPVWDLGAQSPSGLPLAGEIGVHP